MDYLIYFLTYWYDHRLTKFKWSSPLEKACYALGITTIFLLFGILIIVLYLYKLKLIPNNYILGIGIIIGFLVIQFYCYIYIRKNRYDRILVKYKSANVNKGVRTSILFVILSSIIPLILAVCLLIPKN